MHARFAEITRGAELDQVLAGIEEARQAGLVVKTNSVVLRGKNDDELESLVRWAWARSITPRFIELMPLGEGAKLPSAMFVPRTEMQRALAHLLQEGSHIDEGAGPARYWRSTDGAQKVGFITSVSEEFCASCNRFRLTAVGGSFAGGTVRNAATGLCLAPPAPAPAGNVWARWLAGGDVARGSVAAFCGPLTDVPHLIAACGVSNGGIDLYIDFRPRADGAYDLKYATLAAYPEPSTRDAFAKASNRKDFAGAYFTPKLEAWRTGLLTLPGATPNAPLSLEHTAALSAGPMLLDLRLPLSDASASAAAAACTSAVDTWLHWMTHAEEMKRALAAGMRQTATYTRDTKVRQQHFGFLLGKYAPLFGEADGKALTKADAGPLDEAYVGGGS
jgi:hypothetical protein